MAFIMNLMTNAMLLALITKACKLKNDRVQTRLPIFRNLLELILFEIEQIFCTQVYLSILFKTVFVISFYGLLRIGQVLQSNHVAKAKNACLGVNKDKLLITLYSSKTHDKGSRP